MSSFCINTSALADSLNPFIDGQNQWATTNCGYKALLKVGVTELACWAHAWRKFVDLHKPSQSPVALKNGMCCGKKKPSPNWSS
ncbi:IS66 family transposase [Deefgea rivuli]|uniref:IS66 family transposase n=1 Tax=Deefgea rivuli TaxID=400948 RepID=UPI0012EC1342